MHSETLISALAKQMDSLETFLASALVVAVITYWAGLVRNEHIEILGLKVEREYASFVTGAAFLFFNLAILFSFMRVKALLIMVPDDHFVEAATLLATHQWLFNPYSYFGSNDSSAAVITSYGFGALIVVWWLCNTSLTLLQDLDRMKSSRVYRFTIVAIAGIFLAIGLLTMITIQSTYGIIITRVSAELRAALLDTASARFIFQFIGIGLGLVVFMFSLRIKQVLSRSQLSTGIITVDTLPLSSAELDLSQQALVMRGLPLHFSGWNGIFHKVKETKNNRGVWARPAHLYKWFIPLPIIGVTIWFDDSSWILHRDGDHGGDAMVRSEHSNDTPEGEWQGKAKVTSQ